MEPSILKSTKRLLNLDEDDPSFDLDVMIHINSALATANQLGVGDIPFIISGDTETWESFGLPSDETSMLMTYVFLKVKAIFDPDATSFTLEARKQQMDELSQRLYMAADARRHPLPEEVA